MSDEEDGGGHGDEELWLVSYADMMTLLFGFFVLMYTFAMAKLDKIPWEINDDMVGMRKEVATYFGGEYIAPFQKDVDKFKNAIGGNLDSELIEIKTSPEGLDIKFQSKVLFDSGKADLKPAIKNGIFELAKLAKEEEGEFRVEVEGHTDDVPIVGAKNKYPTNWELSSARASSVIRVFEDAGYAPGRLMAIGYGSARPIVPNRNPDGTANRENQAKNRRIKIKIALIDPGQVAGESN